MLATRRIGSNNYSLSASCVDNTTRQSVVLETFCFFVQIPVVT